MIALDLPENIREMAPGEKFQFRCHPEVACFTDCCRQLDLALSPYDVLRLRGHLQLSAAEFLEKYALIEQEPGATFPTVYLAMVDDGRASCPFVSAQGCRVYADRPGACRIYPLGRGAFSAPDGSSQELHVLIREPHCQGFDASAPRDLDDWKKDQELATYNQVNDELLAVLQHPRVKQGLQLSANEREAFILALYRLDELRERLGANSLEPSLELSDHERQMVADDDLALLRFGIRWVQHALLNK
ncbi:MAG: YkgJ family cysteine cluster protein [Desulfobulbaceae bacterium]|nr:YkgJ family cysteine cluster protein [Desulfobulbaceae bacterium]HIJ78184.1 YkgJ family cysteine cluster protein [Deltaproteobacteria bacterium]